MLNLHEEEFQVLAGCVLIGRDEAKPVIWTPGYVTTSMVVEVWVTRIHALPWHAGPEQGGSNSYSYWS